MQQQQPQQPPPQARPQPQRAQQIRPSTAPPVKSTIVATTAVVRATNGTAASTIRPSTAPIRPSTAPVQRPPAVVAPIQPKQAIGSNAAPPVSRAPTSTAPVRAPPKLAQPNVVAQGQRPASTAMPISLVASTASPNTTLPLAGPTTAVRQQTPPALGPNPQVRAPIGTTLPPAKVASVATAARPTTPVREPVSTVAVSAKQSYVSAFPPLIETPTPTSSASTVPTVTCHTPVSTDLAPSAVSGLPRVADSAPLVPAAAPDPMPTTTLAGPKKDTLASPSVEPAAQDAAHMPPDHVVTPLPCTPMAQSKANHAADHVGNNDAKDVQPSVSDTASDATVFADSIDQDAIEAECDPTHHAKRRRTDDDNEDDAMEQEPNGDTVPVLEDNPQAATHAPFVDQAECEHAHAPTPPPYDSDPAPEPADSAWPQKVNTESRAESSPGQIDHSRLRNQKQDHRDKPTPAVDATKDLIGTNKEPRLPLVHTASHKQGPPARESPVYPPPPPDEHRAGHRRLPGACGVQVSPCGRVIDRPVAREIALGGPWKLPADSDLDGAADGDGVNPTRTAVRFWLTRPVESVRVVGAPCEFCLAVDGAVIEPHSVGGLLEMGDVCDADSRPSRWPAGAAGDRLYRALSIVRRARIHGQAIAPGVLDLTGIETALVFRGRLDRDTLDRMVVRFATYNVWRECRSADGKTLTSGQWLYGS
ncbi:Atrophin-1 incomplete domain containing protein [Pandoravirus quercus]|uniref:Atrophin-1 incomplete domain containing protein n=1 Tax=Pandoravirus quercus TaxID=2107709 RepID=A0A2U7U7S8_9VIRU|nr:Atrophin-1 incomplete domain containing protein [Pandoravirus quercus]AVK74477.1 Atrophin-1 incomplete domain containing protein [Pandoravirus quercus]